MRDIARWPRWIVAAVGIAFGLTVGHAAEHRSGAPADAVPAQQAREAGRSTVRATPGARRPARGAEAGARAMVASLRRDGYRSGVAIGRLGQRQHVDTVGALADEPRSTAAAGFLFVAGLARDAPELTRRASTAEMIAAVLDGRGGSLGRLRRELLRANYGTLDPMVSASTVLSDAGAVGASAAAPTATDLVRALRSIAAGCAYPSVATARAILRPMNAVTPPEIDPAGTPAVAFEPSYTFAYGELVGTAPTTVALVGRGDDALAVAVAVDAPTPDPNLTAALSRAWSALGERVDPPADGPSLPRRCTQ